MYTQADLARLVPLPEQNTNKYARGKLIIIGGSRRYPGSVCLAAWASQYAGSGYTEVFTHSDNRRLLVVQRPSLVARSFEDCVPGSLLPTDHKGAVVFGPGLNSSKKKYAVLVEDVLNQVPHPILLDGGAFDLISKKTMRKILKKRKDSGAITILTPHSGEAHRLAEAASVNLTDSYHDAAILAQAYSSLVILKGPETVISDATRTELYSYGTPALAKAGTGDVLSGITGALLAQGLDAFDAAYLGVSLHCTAGKLAAEEMTTVSVAAEEVIACIPGAIKTLVERFS